MEKAANLTSEASKILNAKSRRKRQHNNNEIPTEPETKVTTQAPISINSNTFEVFDGLLDQTSNYTGFVEVIGMYILFLLCKQKVFDLFIYFPF